MWGCVRVSWLVLGLALAPAGCDTPQAAQDEAACTTVCRCVTTLASERDACVTDCIGELGPVSDACATCIYQNAERCPVLLDACQAACVTSQPLEEEGAP